MIVKCGKCGKKYKVDETIIVGEQARIKCKSCDNILVIRKPKPIKEKQDSFEGLDSMDSTEDNRPKGSISAKGKPPAGSKLRGMSEEMQSGFRGLTIGIKFFIIFMISAITMGGVLIFVYLQYVPSLMSEQIAIRTLCISRSVSSAVKHPLLVRDYLRVNQVAETNSKLPDVAYISIVNKKGIVIAGIFDDLERFSPQFVASVKQKGFPKELPLKNFIPQGKTESSKDFSIGGQKIYDVAVSIGDTGGVIHVGTFIGETGKVLLNSMEFLIIAVLGILGILSFFIAGKIITHPIKKLANEARRVSLGEISDPITIKGSGEIEVLAASLEKMRSSM